MTIPARSLLYPADGEQVTMPTLLSGVDTTGFTTEENKLIRKLVKRAYHRSWYRHNRKKMSKYMRGYRKRRKSSRAHNEPRESVRRGFTIGDIQWSAPEKTIRMLDMILCGDGVFVA